MEGFYFNGVQITVVPICYACSNGELFIWFEIFPVGSLFLDELPERHPFRAGLFTYLRMKVNHHEASFINFYAREYSETGKRLVAQAHYLKERPDNGR